MIESNKDIISPDQDIHFMQHAINLAHHAQSLGEVPVGAVVVYQGKIIAEGWNHPIADHDPTAHAEIMALRAAGKWLKNYRLLDTTIYVTLEPCAMCAAAMIHARVGRLVFGARDYKAGAAGSVFNLTSNEALNHKMDVTGAVLEPECSQLISCFFKLRRAEKKRLKKMALSGR